MNCPCCGREMQYGYISAGGFRVIWTPKEHKMSSLPGKDGVRLTAWTLSGKGTRAHICKACRKVIVDY